MFDLWHRGHLVVNETDGSIHLPVDVAEKITQGRLEDLAPAEVIDETREVMLDRLSGHVLPMLRGDRPLAGEGRAIVPVEHFDVGLQDVTTAGLLAALRRVLDDEEERDGRQKQVLGAHLSIPELAPATRRGWLRLEVRCQYDQEADRLTVREVDAMGLPAAARSRATERLNRLIEDWPDLPFVGYLRDAATAGAVEAVDPAALLAELTEKVAASASLAAVPWVDRQRQLDGLADRLEEECLRREGATALVEVIAGHEAHARAAASLIRAADRQVVIAGPFVEYAGLQPLLRPIQEALEKGVQVFLLWGIGDEELKSMEVRNALTQLREGYRFRFFVSQRSSRTHAKVVVRDDRQALVTSLNLLRPSGSDTLEVGAVLTAKDDGPCPPVEALLEWARGVYPEYLIGQGLYVGHEEFCLGGDETVAEIDLPRPVVPAVEADVEVAAVAGRLWQLSWQDYIYAVRGRLGRAEEGVQVLRDGQHRDALWEGLRHARRRLLITSDQLGPEVVDPTFLQHLEERVQAGVFVTLVYRRLTEAAVKEGSDVEERLKALAARYPDKLLLACGRNHAKIFVHDDVAIVSSFNFLSFDGYYEAGRRQRSEIGARFTGAAVEQAVEAVRAAFPGALAPWPACSPAAAASARPLDPLPPVTPEQQQRLLAALAAAEGAGRLPILRSHLGGAQDPWWLLDRLQQGGLSESLLRVGAATLLYGRSDTPPDVRDRWLRWLAEDAWRRKRFVETAVLLDAYPGLASPRLPRPGLAMLAAAWTTKRTARALEELYVSGGLSPTEQAVVAGVAATDLILHGTREAEEIIVEFHDAAMPAWRSLLEHVQAYWEQTYQPLPLSDLRADRASAEHRQALAQAWDDLQTALAELQSKNFRFDSGIKTQAHLYHPNGPLGQLLALVHARDSTGLRRWLGEEMLDDQEEFLDTATKTAGDDLELIVGPARQAILTKLRAIRNAARQVVKVAPLSAADGDPALLTAAQGLARVIHESWQRLQDESGTLDAPEGALLLAALDGLREVADLGRSDAHAP
jgi:phosphatidylserine/phosphatidylglycerophosphate/cardiolipin synthase-like enzyme